MKTTEELKNARLVTNLNRFSTMGHNIHGEDIEVDRVLSKLKGATIISAGFVPDENEGGLAFDYIKDDEKFRVIFGYNELGEWIKYHGVKND